MTRLLFLGLLLSVLMMLTFVAGQQAPHAREKPILVFAAASLKDALEPIAADFEVKTGQMVTLSFAATSSLARQIAAGAPADLFVSADIGWVAWLKAQNLTAPETERIIAHNRLALIAPADSTFFKEQGIAEILLAWRKQGRGRLALADPEHVPAGRYARAALKELESQIGLYEVVNERFAIAGNVRLATLLVARKEAPLGIVYQSDAMAETRVKVVGLFSPESYPDIVYPALRTRDGLAKADIFLDYLVSPAAQGHIRDAGLIIPTGGL